MGNLPEGLMSVSSSSLPATTKPRSAGDPALLPQLSENCAVAEIDVGGADLGRAGFADETANALPHHPLAAAL